MLHNKLVQTDPDQNISAYSDVMFLLARWHAGIIREMLDPVIDVSVWLSVFLYTVYNLYISIAFCLTIDAS